MWKSPGAMTAQPGQSGSPETHSRTGNADLAVRRAANREVKIGGICCAITIGTEKFGGTEGKSRASASGPPVETPIATTCTGDNRGRGGKSVGGACDLGNGRWRIILWASG